MDLKKDLAIWALLSVVKQKTNQNNPCSNHLHIPYHLLRGSQLLGTANSVAITTDLRQATISEAACKNDTGCNLGRIPSILKSQQSESSGGKIIPHQEQEETGMHSWRGKKPELSSTLHSAPIAGMLLWSSPTSLAELVLFKATGVWNGSRLARIRSLLSRKHIKDCASYALTRPDIYGLSMGYLFSLCRKGSGHQKHKTLYYLSQKTYNTARSDVFAIQLPRQA